MSSYPVGRAADAQKLWEIDHMCQWEGLSDGHIPISDVSFSPILIDDRAHNVQPSSGLITIVVITLFYIKCNAVSKLSSNFSSKEYRQCFRIKRRGVSPSPALERASCSNFAVATTYSLLDDGFIFLRFYSGDFVCPYLEKNIFAQSWQFV